jgi:protein-S-isoprenylcysteine O-methyltransferase Ste14
MPKSLVFSMTKRLLRHLLGYAFGLAVFLFLLPLAIYAVARVVEPPLGIASLHCGRAQSIAVAALALVGAYFLIGSNLYLFFVGHGGPADVFGRAISPRTTRLVVTGPYRYTRNPMVFGALVIYAAWALHLGSPLSLAAIILAPLAIVRYLRWAEERRLVDDFADEYQRYRARTSLLLPWPPGE